MLGVPFNSKLYHYRRAGSRWSFAIFFEIAVRSIKADWLNPKNFRAIAAAIAAG
jgi:hypothetical protein